MVRNVTLNPLNMVLKTSNTSRIGDAMGEVYQTHSSGANRRRSGSLNASPSESHGNLLPVKSAVLDENFAGMPAADHYSRQIYPRNIAFVRLRIHVRLFCHRVKLHSQALDKFEIRVVSSQKEDLFRRKPFLPFAFSITTASEVISFTVELKCIGISPAFTRFSMSGLTQYLMVEPSSASRCTIVTWAPLRHKSSAASAAEFFPPTTTTS